MPSFYLRSALIFLCGLPIGYLTQVILDHAPLTSLETHPEAGEAGHLIFVHGFALWAVGFVDGYYNRSTDHDRALRHQGITIIALSLGLVIAMLASAWPIALPDLTGHLAQITIGLGSTLYFFFAHIAGTDVWEKRSRASQVAT